MLDTLQKMSGTTHKTFIESKTVTVDKSRLVFQTDNNVTYTPTTKEVPVISYNDMAFISERNSIVFRAGDPTVWNRNETILPMSWRLFQNTIQHAGHDYTLQTIPTLSTVLDFDLRKNQPDFEKMLNKRMYQACLSVTAQDAYKNAYNFSDFDISRIDPDNYADDIMEIINKMIQDDMKAEDGECKFDSKAFEESVKNAEPNTEVLDAVKDAQAKMDKADEKLYAGGMISRNMIVGMGGQVNHQFDNDILQVYTNTRNDFASDKAYFYVRKGSLYGVDGTLYIERNLSDKDYESLEEKGKDVDSKVYIEGRCEKSDLNVTNGYSVKDAFLKFLVEQDAWKFAGGKFESGMAYRMMNK